MRRYQKVVNVRLDIERQLSLSDALTLADLEEEGRAYDGLVDAYNTSRLVSKLELNPDYKLTLEKLREEEEDDTPIGTSLGSLLCGLELDKE